MQSIDYEIVSVIPGYFGNCENIQNKTLITFLEFSEPKTITLKFQPTTIAEVNMAVNSKISLMIEVWNADDESDLVKLVEIDESCNEKVKRITYNEDYFTKKNYTATHARVSLTPDSKVRLYFLILKTHERTSIESSSKKQKPIRSTNFYHEQKPEKSPFKSTNPLTPMKKTQEMGSSLLDRSKFQRSCNSHYKNLKKPKEPSNSYKNLLSGYFVSCDIVSDETRALVFRCCEVLGVCCLTDYDESSEFTLVDPLEDQKDLPRKVSYKWLLDCMEEGEKLSIENYYI